MAQPTGHDHPKGEPDDATGRAARDVRAAIAFRVVQLARW